MPNTYFFSDAHLGIGPREEDRYKERSIISFLEMVRQDGETLFIMGDLFDFWFEYDSVVPKGYFRLFTKLADLTSAGINVSYLAGNHDFWLKTYFRDELGMEVFPDPVDRVIHGKRFYLHHGDGLLKNDTGYRILKRILRNKVNISLFSLLHPDLASRIAAWSSRKSRKHTSNRIYEGNDMVEFAGQKIKQGFDYVVMGHNHVAQISAIGGGIYVNLGDWITEYTYAVFDGTKLDLKKWSAG
ncbi:MAG TPA: UDP-2,3-diacylglucosamine diphosphatase [Bacteroidetes bacterium]|nr:UDP-2,3-diacylglucosamine diphosphatase [Bacteroidota bacterium]